MRLTTKGKFAVTALVDIALYGAKSPVSLSDVSQRQSISVSYLEQLFLKLRRHGLVKSYKGPGGGYILTKGATNTMISEIIAAVDETLDARTCQGMRNCHENHKCLTHDLWDGLTTHVYDYLSKISVQDVINKYSKRKSHNTIKFIHK